MVSPSKYVPRQQMQRKSEKKLELDENAQTMGALHSIGAHKQQKNRREEHANQFSTWFFFLLRADYYPLHLFRFFHSLIC